MQPTYTYTFIYFGGGACTYQVKGVVEHVTFGENDDMHLYGQEDKLLASVNRTYDIFTITPEAEPAPEPELPKEGVIAA